MKSNPSNVVICQAKKRNITKIWHDLCEQAQQISESEPRLAPLLEDVILSRNCLGEALTARLARKLAREDMGRHELEPILKDVFVDHQSVTESVASDMVSVFERDPACDSILEPLLYLKGFLALSIYRVAHHLWLMDRRPLALYFQSICSETFGVDIHPAARIGCGVMLDHATSIVVGETAIIEDNVSILHEVTLGGTGKEQGDRHPIVRSGVLIGAGSKLLGRIEIGQCAKIGAGSVVLEDVAARKTVAGVPAVVVGNETSDSPALDMNQSLECGQI